MKEYIEKIIEIILENISCDHPEIEEYPRGAKSNDPTYCLENEKAVIEKCIEAIPARLIERPEITDRFILEKAEELFNKLFHAPGMIYKGPYVQHMNTIKDCLSSLLNELSAKINLIGQKKKVVNEEFINEQVKGMEQLFLNCDGGFNRFMLNMPQQLKKIFKKLDIEIWEG